MRAEAVKRRAALCSIERDEAIANHFFASDLMKYQAFFVYLSVRTEVKTQQIIEGLLARKKTVCVPKVFGSEMKSVRLTQPLVEGKFGILQPQSGQEETAQVALVPLLSADRQGNRLGYGGGYYDRYFAAHPNVLRIGVAYEGQFVASVPTEETDVPLDGFLTESGVSYVGKE